MSRAGICIPVADDPQGLRDTLVALHELGPEAADAYVVVAVDGSDPATCAVAQAYGVTCVGLPARRGSYAARNAAIAVLPDDVDVVLFTDAGCLPQPGWITGHRRALDGAAMSGGAVEVSTSARPTAAEWVDRHRNLRQQSYVEVDGFAATCNLAVRRKVVDELLFDDQLKSGGDRDYCVRARDAGFDLVYSPAAAVEHPARRTARSVVAKARRVGLGIAAMPTATRPTRLPKRRPGLELARTARRSGLRRSAWWHAQVTLVDALRARALHRAAAPRARRSSLVDLHVVVLLGSNFGALEGFSTRWREFIRAWAVDPRIDRLSVVDHPQMRRRALVERHPVREAPSWLPGVDRWSVALGVDAQLRWSDRIAARRAARQLRKRWPQARRRVIVAATPLSAPLLPHLREAGTLVAFDGVDHASMRRRFASMIDRVEAGYRAGAAADLVTAVSPVLTDELAALGAKAPIVIPNGADLDAFAQPQPRPMLDLPTQPYALFVGVLGNRNDVALITRLAELLPDVPIVAAGPAEDDRVRDMVASSTVQWLGPVDPMLLPAVMQHAGCGLLPFTDTDVTATDSMKLLQYLAAGLPVVSTPMRDLPQGVRVASSAVEFAAEVRAALCDRRQPAESTYGLSSWHDLADQLLTHYLDALGP